MSAENLMSVATSLIKSAVQAELQAKQFDFMKEVEEFTALVTEKDKDLARAMDLATSENLFDPMQLIGNQPFIMYGEDPDSLFSRAIHSGNGADTTLRSVHDYVASHLVLPDAHKSLA